MTLYYIETTYGCGIRVAYNIQQARKNALREEGESNVMDIRKATKEDIGWVGAMGGRVPEDIEYPGRK